MPDLKSFSSALFSQAAELGQIFSNLGLVLLIFAATFFVLYPLALFLIARPLFRLLRFIALMGGLAFVIVVTYAVSNSMDSASAAAKPFLREAIEVSEKAGQKAQPIISWMKDHIPSNKVTDVVAEKARNLGQQIIEKSETVSDFLPEQSFTQQVITAPTIYWRMRELKRSGQLPEGFEWGDQHEDSKKSLPKNLVILSSSLASSDIDNNEKDSRLQSFLHYLLSASIGDPNTGATMALFSLLITALAGASVFLLLGIPVFWFFGPKRRSVTAESN